MKNFLNIALTAATLTAVSPACRSSKASVADIAGCYELNGTQAISLYDGRVLTADVNSTATYTVSHDDLGLVLHFSRHLEAGRGSQGGIIFAESRPMHVPVLMRFGRVVIPLPVHGSDLGLAELVKVSDQICS